MTLHQRRFNERVSRITGSSGLRLALALVVTAAFGSRSVRAEPGATAEAGLPAIHHLADLETITSPSRVAYEVGLRGTVWYADGSGMLLLHDETGTEALNVDLTGRAVHVGEQLSIHGTASVARVDGGYELIATPVVDNDGLHATQEKSGAVKLSAGWHPLRITWFNAGGEFGLSLEWEGPGMPLQPIPAENFARTLEPAVAPGLDYHTYSGRWWSAPQTFDARLRIDQGVLPTVDLPASAKHDLRAMEFTGYVRVPQEGTYTWYLSSDDGSRLYIGPASLQVDAAGEGELPSARRIVPGQTLPADKVGLTWASMEGLATSVFQERASTVIQLQAGIGQANVRLTATEPWIATILPHAMVRVTGVCRPDLSPDQLAVATTLLVQDPRQIEITEATAETWRSVPRLSVDELRRRLASSRSSTGVELVRLQGVVAQAHGAAFVLRDGSAELRFTSGLRSELGNNTAVEVLALPEDREVRALCIRALPEGERVQPLTLVEQIHQLSPAELARAPAVKISGVVTCSFPEQHAIILQDASRGIYVEVAPNDSSAQVGDFLEIDGNALPGEFSPYVRALRARHIGTGALPDPIEAAGEQLIDGSLHCQYVEVEGYVSEIHGDVVSLFLRSGRVKIRLEDATAQMLREAAGAVVRIRGCLFATWDKQTHRVQVGAVTFDNASIAFEQTAPADPFSAPKKRAAELLRFDPRQNFFRRICVAGEVLYANGRMLYLTDGPDPVRVETAGETNAAPGDVVIASGFAEFEGPTPLIAEAAVRKTGTAPLPPPLPLGYTPLLQETFDSRRVVLTAEVTGISRDGNTWLLELAHEHTRFRALLEGNGDIRLPEIGSKLAVTGVYAARGGNRAAGVPIQAFDLLLNSPRDVRVLANPPWWTLQRLLVFLGILAVGLAAALVWIRSLHRQVAQKTGELKREIEERQQVEQQRALEQERTRLANDLHDDLGAGLTEVSLLGALAKTPALTAEDRDRYLRRVTETARRLVDTLDEIVWAVNPKYDSVASLPAYLSSYAQRFFEAAAIQCRLDIPDDLPETRLSSSVRHNLFLAFKEVLNNVVRHANATEVTLRVRAVDSGLVLTVIDNGVGANLGEVAPGMEGLASIKNRLATIGGTAEVTSERGRGTTVTLTAKVR